MKNIYGWLKTASLLVLLGFTSSAMATTGYFGLGYGAKSMGMVGATVSNPQDSIAAATNPAGMALVGERADFGLRFFSPQRDAELTTSALGAGADYGAPFDVDDKSRRDLFMIPNIGFTQQVKGNDRLWWGLSIYGNGGMNSTYDRNLYDETAAFLGAITLGPPPDGPAVPPAFVPEGSTTGTPNTSVLGVDLAQALFAPTLSYKVAEKHTLGASLLIGVQRFSARGLGNFQCFTSAATNPANAALPNPYGGVVGPACAPGAVQGATPGFVPSSGLTNNGNSWSYGAGVRVGWIGEVSPQVTLGLAAASKVYMSEFDDYDELFAEEGDFDIPANVTAGITVKATPKVNISFDYQRIFYGDVKSLANAGPVPTPVGPGLPPGGGLLGTDNGLGFGWEDTSVYRLAAEYMHNDKWTLRAGFALNDQPIPDDQVLFNILAPAVIKKHATLGFTYSPDKRSEWNFAYMHAFEEKVKTAQSPFSLPFPGGDLPAEINMYQDSVDVSYSMKF